MHSDRIGDHRGYYALLDTFFEVLDSVQYITLADLTLFSCQNVDNLRTACMVHQIKIVFVIRPVCPSRIKAQSNIIANQV